MSQVAILEQRNLPLPVKTLLRSDVDNPVFVCGIQKTPQVLTMQDYRVRIRFWGIAWPNHLCKRAHATMRMPVMVF